MSLVHFSVIKKCGIRHNAVETETTNNTGKTTDCVKRKGDIPTKFLAKNSLITTEIISKTTKPAVA